MKRMEKAALGCALLLVSACVVSILVLLFTDFGTGALRQASHVAAKGRALSALDEKYPFTPPADGRISEERLLVFLDAGCRSKAAADAVEPWLETHDRVKVMGEPVYSGEGAALMMDYLQSLHDALDAVRMGPHEFDWTYQWMAAAAAGPPSAKKQEKLHRLAEELLERSEDSRFPAREREELKRQTAEIEKMPDFWGPAMQADYALAQKYADRMKACLHGRRAVHAMGDLLRSGPGDVRIEINPPEPPEPESSEESPSD